LDKRFRAAAQSLNACPFFVSDLVVTATAAFNWLKFIDLTAGSSIAGQSQAALVGSGFLLASDSINLANRNLRTVKAEICSTGVLRRVLSVKKMRRRIKWSDHRRLRGPHAKKSPA